MTINVKFLSEQQIERDALGLLEAYFRERWARRSLLRSQWTTYSKRISVFRSTLRISQHGLEVLMCSVPLYAKSAVGIHRPSLDPIEHPEMEGRYHFTVGTRDRSLGYSMFLSCAGMSCRPSCIGNLVRSRCWFAHLVDARSRSSGKLIDLPPAC